SPPITNPTLAIAPSLSRLINAMSPICTNTPGATSVTGSGEGSCWERPAGVAARPNANPAPSTAQTRLSALLEFRARLSALRSEWLATDMQLAARFLLLRSKKPERRLYTGFRLQGRQPNGNTDVSS